MCCLAKGNTMECVACYIRTCSNLVDRRHGLIGWEIQSISKPLWTIPELTGSDGIHAPTRRLSLHTIIAANITIAMEDTIGHAVEGALTQKRLQFPAWQCLDEFLECHNSPLRNRHSHVGSSQWNSCSGRLCALQKKSEPPPVYMTSSIWCLCSKNWDLMKVKKSFLHLHTSAGQFVGLSHFTVPIKVHPFSG